MPLRGDILLMSFEGMRKSIRTTRAPISTPDAPAHLSDEMPMYEFHPQG